MRIPNDFKLALSIVAAVFVVGGGGFWIWDQFGPRAQMEAKARADWGFTSLVERLPKGKPIAPRISLDEESRKRWEKLEERISYDDDKSDLKALHEKTRRFFVDYPGTGSGRSFQGDNDRWLRNYKDVYLPQPGAPADFPLSQAEKLNPVQASDEFHSTHLRSQHVFLSGFGYMKDKDRGQVAGFKSHGFRMMYFGAKDEWRIDHIQLVGILTQAQPIVYLTDKMPSMDQIRHGKTRGLDFFEEVALPKLCDGDDLYIVRKNDTIRMLGALRATKTCQKCHDAEIGDLLGAFSYTLRPAPIEPKQDE
jgi:hypothetical protein